MRGGVHRVSRDAAPQASGEATWQQAMRAQPRVSGGREFISSRATGEGISRDALITDSVWGARSALPRVIPYLEAFGINELAP